MQFFRFSEFREALFLGLRPWLWLRKPLELKDLAINPIEQFTKWYINAKRCFWSEFPNAMCLSTLDADGYPDGRNVLLKDYSEQGFVFYTNYNSTKGKALEKNPKAALTFYWNTLQRQIRIQGRVEKVSEVESEDYFRKRPRLSQIGAWASLQSEQLPSRSTLEERLKHYELEFQSKDIPKPPYWGGYRVIPERMEFWQIRFNRLHDRFLYTKATDGSWTLKQLYP